MKSLKNETAYLATLQKMNIYYIQHKKNAQNEGLESFKGPQNYQDRLDVEKFHTTLCVIP